MVFCDEKRAAEFATCPGDPMRPIYKPVIDEKGNLSIEVSGYENTDEKIQSYADSCDIHTIINRVNQGDLNALNVRQGMYGDFTHMPKTMAEVLQLQIDARIAFDSLDKETKKKFDNDINKFMAMAGSDQWLENLGAIKPSDDEVKEGVAE